VNQEIAINVGYYNCTISVGNLILTIYVGVMVDEDFDCALPISFRRDM
jgi:hypothetical protein